MGIFIKVFNENSEYEAFKISDKFKLPNVSWVRNNDIVKFNEIVKAKNAKLTCHYLSTEDNLLAFTSGQQSIQKLVVDGNNIEFEPVVETETSFDVLSSEITINADGGTVTFPDSYLLDSVPSSLTIRPKDDSIKIGGSVCLLMFGKAGGGTMYMPMDQENAEEIVIFDVENNKMVANDYFLNLYDSIIQEGFLYGFGLCNVDENEGTISVIDAVVSRGNITGGVPVPYYFDTAGQHTVEMTFNKTNIGGPNMFIDTTSGVQAPLTSVEIGEDTTSIGDFVFNACTVTGELVIPDSVTSIGNEAFRDCSGLTSVTIGSGITSIENNTFYNCSGLTGITIPNSVTSIGERVFYNCSGMTGTLIIPDSVTSIGKSAFNDCSGLTNITIPNSVTYIGEFAFYNCSGLTSVTIGSGITSIENTTFYNCSGLTGITIPSSVKNIGGSAFAYCSGLTEITCHAVTAPSIEFTTFQDVKPGGTLYVPVGSIESYSTWMSTSDYYLGYYNWTIQEIS